MKVHLMDESKKSYNYASDVEILEALERYKKAPYRTEKNIFQMQFTGRQISVGDLDVLEPFLNAFCKYSIRIGTDKFGPVDTGAFSEVCVYDNEYAIVKCLNETVFILAVETYLTYQDVKKAVLK